MSFWRTNHCVTWQATAGQTTAPSARACTPQDLAEFEDLLAEAVELLPLRTCDHRIHLPGTPSVVVCPYR